MLLFDPPHPTGDAAIKTKSPTSAKRKASFRRVTLSHTAKSTPIIAKLTHKAGDFGVGHFHRAMGWSHAEPGV